MIFPPAFLDSSSWNDNHNQLHLQQHAYHQHQQQQLAASGGCGGGDGNHELLQQSIMQPGTLSDGGGGGGGGAVGPAKPMSMSERARLARIPQPEQGLKCPRCDSTNTKFCYFNNYSLSQPRHFCRACRRYWTRGGALRNVPVGGGYRRHAKRAKPKAAAASAAASATTAGSTPAGSTTSSTCTVSLPAAMQQLSGSNHHNLSSMLPPPPLLRLADFDAMSLGSTFSGMGKPSAVDAAGCYSSSVIGGGNSAAAAGLEQWRLHQQMQSFPFFHAMDHHQQHAVAMAPAPAMAMPGMFHLGLDGGGDGYSKRGMYGGGEHHLSTGAGAGYSYSSATAGNHLL